MKKALFFSMAVAVVALASCAKNESELLETPQGKTHVIHAIIDDQDSKTTYTEEGVFSWVQSDELKLVVYKATDESKAANFYRYRAQDSGSKVDFAYYGSGSPDFTTYPRAGVAVYPSDLTIGGSYGAYTVTLPTAYEVSGTDFAAVKVPMIGTTTPDDGESYIFKTAVGVLKVTLANVPSVASKLVLTSSADNLSGVFPLDAENGLLMSECTASAGHSITVNFPAQEDGATIDVYIPVPVGSISAGATLSVQTSESAEIMTTPATTQAIAISRSHLTPIAGAIDASFAENWVSLGEGKFIDTFVWAEKGWTAPVSVEIFQEATTGQYRMENPYVIANGAALEGAGKYLTFSIVEKGRIAHDWLEMGLTLSKNASKTWAMIDGKNVSGKDDYDNDFSHVVSFNADGTPAQIQIAPCYRTSDESHSGYPLDYDNEIGKNHSNGIIEIAFPGADLLTPFVIPAERIKVSANAASDGTGAAGLIDNDLATYWHSPWSGTPVFDTTYGQYVTIKLPEAATKIAFNYCTRNTNAQTGAPAKVIVGGTQDGTTWTILGTLEYDYMFSSSPNTWVGLPALDVTGYIGLRFGIATNQGGQDLTNITSSANQWCNLSELMVYGVSTGEELPYYPDLEPGQVWVKESMVTAADICSHDGGGLPALIDGDVTTYWHSNWYYAVTGNDPTYGIFFDIELGTPLQNFHFAYNVRSGNSGAKPTAIVLGVSNDGSTWTQLGDSYATDDMLNASAGARVTLPSVDAGAAYKYLRFGITDSANNDTGSLTGDLNFNGTKKCTNLAELLLFAD